MKNKQKKIRKLQLRERELALREKNKKMLTVISMPCELGGEFVLQMTEGYTKEDLMKVKEWIFKMLPVTTKLYEEVSWDSVS